jgi:hypothetical protein
MDEKYFSETSVDFQWTTRRYVPEYEFLYFLLFLRGNELEIGICLGIFFEKFAPAVSAC